MKKSPSSGCGVNWLGRDRSFTVASCYPRESTPPRGVETVNVLNDGLTGKGPVEKKPVDRKGSSHSEYFIAERD